MEWVDYGQIVFFLMGPAFPYTTPADVISIYLYYVMFMQAGYLKAIQTCALGTSFIPSSKAVGILGSSNAMSLNYMAGVSDTPNNKVVSSYPLQIGLNIKHM